MANYLILGAVVGVSLYGIYRATEPAGVLASTTGPATALNETPGAQSEEKSIRAQDAREVGFLGRAQIGAKGYSVYATDFTVVDPGATSVMKLNQYKTNVSDDHTTWANNHTKYFWSREYIKPLTGQPQFKSPLIGTVHPGAEIKSGQNVGGELKLLSSNPFTYVENTGKETRINEKKNRATGQTFGTGDSMNYNRYSETRMSWGGLRNPWNIAGTQRNLNSYTPLDKDQLTGTVPLNDPQKIFDVGGRPTNVVAPPGRGRNTTIFNQPLNLGRTRAQRK